MRGWMARLAEIAGRETGKGDLLDWGAAMEYIEKHGAEVPRAVAGAVSECVKDAFASARARVGLGVMDDADMRGADVYAGGYVDRMGRQVRGYTRNQIAYTNGAPRDDWRARLAAMGSERGAELAEKEAVTLTNVTDKHVYLTAGYEVVWAANPGACRVCLALDGQTVRTEKTSEGGDKAYFEPSAMASRARSDKFYYGRVFAPPAHRGCRCSIRPGKMIDGTVDADNGLQNVVEQGIINESGAAVLAERLKTGVYPRTIRAQVQRRHHYGAEWLSYIGRGKYESVFYRNVDIQAIVDEYVGTAPDDSVYLSDTRGDSEYVTLPYPVGRYYERDIGRYIETSRICIRFAKRGLHMFPTNPLTRR